MPGTGKFLDEVIKVNELQNIETLHGRAEDYAKNKEYREQFDVCVSRAVANLSTLSEYCLPYVKVGGVFIAYKAGQIEDELKAGERAVKLLGGEITDVHKFTLPDTDIDKLNLRGTTVIMASHAKRFINLMRRRVVTLVDGRILGDVPRGRYGDLV